MKRIHWKACLREWATVVGMSVFVAGGAMALMSPGIVVAAEDSAKEAATVEEAAKVLDLSTLALAEGAKEPFGRHLGMVSYEAGVDSKSAFEFHQKQLTKLGWKELPGTSSQAAYTSATFQKSGFVVSVTSYAGSDPEKPKSAMISINNLGNVRMSKLPAVKGAKQVFANEVTASYSTTQKPADAVTETRKLLMDAGWEPYGTASNPPDSEVMTFKRNAIRLIAFVGAHPAQKGQVMISYSSTLMSADLPALPNAKDVEFEDTQKVLKFQTADSFDNVAKAYQQRLAKMGWKSTTNEVEKSKFGDDRAFGEMRFANGAKDSLLLQVTDQEGKTQVRLSLKTAADIAALENELKAAIAKQEAEEKARKEAEEAEAKPVAKSKTAKKPAAKSDDGFPDVDSLIKDAVGDALKNGDVDLEKLTKGKIPGTAGAKAAAGSAKGAVSIPVPDNAKKVTQTSDNVLQIKFPAGKGQAAAELIRDQLLAAEWEIDGDDKLTAKSGNLSLNKGNQKLTLSYVDTGFADVNLMLIGIGTKLTEGKVDPNAKAPVASTKPKSKPDADPSGDDPLKSLKKKAGLKPSKSDDDEPKTVKLPKRVEKPVRGIAKLDKLPTEAKLVVNGKPMTLPHVIAYEIADDGRWVTRILATEAPIKQSSLVDLLRKNGDDSELRSMSPRLLVELDDQDKPFNMSYAADRAIGSAGSSGLTGEAIVEEGRARGSFKAKKESEFFGRTIIGEFSFDVPVLTRDGQPAKQLVNAKKLENSGKLLANDKPVKLGNVVAYQVKVFDDVRTAILFTEKPVNMAKLKASLAKDGTDDGLFDFQSQVKVTIDKDDKFSMMNLYHDGASLNSNSDMVGEVVVEDGRARGTVKLGKPSEFFGKTFSFDLTFDVDVLPLPAATK